MRCYTDLAVHQFHVVRRFLWGRLCLVDHLFPVGLLSRVVHLSPVNLQFLVDPRFRQDRQSLVDLPSPVHHPFPRGLKFPVAL